MLGKLLPLSFPYHKFSTELPKLLEVAKSITLNIYRNCKNFSAVLFKHRALIAKAMPRYTNMIGDSLFALDKHKSLESLLFDAATTLINYFIIVVSEH